MKRYGVLLLAALVVGALAAFLGPAWRARETPTPRVSATPVAPIALTLAPGSVTPAMVSVPKDHLVRLDVTNRGTGPVTLTLMGYQDRWGPVSIEPGSSWRGEFLADRPGDDFAWIVDGAAMGRLVVQGAHLVEGHR